MAWKKERPPGARRGVSAQRSFLSERVPANDDLPAEKDLNAERCVRITECPLTNSRAAGRLDHHGEIHVDSTTPGRDQRSRDVQQDLSLIHISEPTRLGMI